MSTRDDLLKQWLQKQVGNFALKLETLTPASADASFRRYFRIQADHQTLIVMDAPPEKENMSAFIQVDSLMQAAGLNVPKIHSYDLEQGFALLSDLGQKTYLDDLKLDPMLAPAYFDAATTALVKWQLASKPNILPVYDQAVLARELALFPEWYVQKHCQVTWTEQQQKWWQMTHDALIKNNLAQSQVFVHRDFMPRNLMVCEDMPGVLDFQDALYGPISYDIASLMRDAFISWDEEFVLDITIRYWEKARAAGLPVPVDFGQFYRDVEWMGLQRHLKVLGIFARINYRDGKPKYLEDTPRFMNYALKTADRYIELSPLRRLLLDLTGQQAQAGYTF